MIPILCRYSSPSVISATEQQHCFKKCEINNHQGCCSRSSFTIESSSRFVKVLYGLHVRKQFAAVHKVHHKIEFVRRLKRHVQRHQERMPHSLQYASLGLDVFGVVFLDDRFLVHDFHRIDSFRVLLAHLNNLTRKPLIDIEYSLNHHQSRRALSYYIYVNDELTWPNEPLPITFNKSKSSMPILLFKKKTPYVR